MIGLHEQKKCRCRQSENHPYLKHSLIALLKIGPLAAASGTIGDVPVVHWSWRHCACADPRRQPTLPSHDGSSTPLPQAEIAYPCFWNSVFGEDLSAVKAFVGLVWRWTLRKVPTDCWLVIGFSFAVHIMKAAPKLQLLKILQQNCFIFQILGK